MRNGLSRRYSGSQPSLKPVSDKSLSRASFHGLAPWRTSQSSDNRARREGLRKGRASASLKVSWRMDSPVLSPVATISRLPIG